MGEIIFCLGATAVLLVAVRRYIRWQNKRDRERGLL